MTLSNHKAFTKARTLLLFLIFAILSDVTISSIPGSIRNLFASHWLAYSSLTVIALLTICNISLFKIEGEYEILHLKSKPLLSTLLPYSTGKRYEFPKSILFKTTLNKGFFCYKLTIYVNTNQGIKKVDTFNLSFISSKKVLALTLELQNQLSINEKVQEPELSSAI